jgi:hypothetical protein
MNYSGLFCFQNFGNFPDSLFIFAVPAFEFRASWVLYPLSQTPIPVLLFALVIFKKGYHVFVWSWPWTMIFLPVQEGKKIN